MECSDWLRLVGVDNGIPRDIARDIVRDVGCNVERSDWLRRGDVDVSACFGSRKRLGPDGAPIARIHPCTSLRLLGLCR